MSFDFHGDWEDVIGHNSPLNPIESASSEMKKLTVSHAANVWVSEGAPAEKILIGMPMYGRTFTLKDVEKFDIGAPAKGGGAEGRWTKEPGYLAYYEVVSDVVSLQLHKITLFSLLKRFANFFNFQTQRWSGITNRVSHLPIMRTNG